MWVYIFSFRKPLRNGSNGLVVRADVGLTLDGGFRACNPKSFVCKVPIIEGLYSKFLPIKEQGCRVIYINTPVLYYRLYIKRKLLTIIVGI